MLCITKDLTYLPRVLNMIQNILHYIKEDEFITTIYDATYTSESSTGTMFEVRKRKTEVSKKRGKFEK